MTEKRKQGVWNALFVTALAIGAIIAMIGCSTIAGVGQDLNDLATWTGDRLDNGFNRPE